jgi:hypothetical protein
MRIGGNLGSNRGTATGPKVFLLLFLQKKKNLFSFLKNAGRL